MSAACLVADSGPLIALGRLDLLGLPWRYFEPVLVTSSVWLEVTRKPGADEAARLSSAAEHHLLRVVADPAAIPAALLCGPASMQASVVQLRSRSNPESLGDAGHRA